MAIGLNIDWKILQHCGYSLCQDPRSNLASLKTSSLASLILLFFFFFITNIQSAQKLARYTSFPKLSVLCFKPPHTLSISHTTDAAFVWTLRQTRVLYHPASFTTLNQPAPMTLTKPATMSLNQPATMSLNKPTNRAVMLHDQTSATVKTLTHPAAKSTLP